MAAAPPPPTASPRHRWCQLQFKLATTPSSTKLRAPSATTTTSARAKQCPRRRPAALPETAAACVAAAGLVGVAATLLAGRPAAEEEKQKKKEKEKVEECSDCGGTGLCPRCKGEGFVFKQLPEETASRARKAAKNMATRYTAGLPTKWTYCNKCSSTRSCTACGGSGTIASLQPPPPTS